MANPLYWIDIRGLDVYPGIPDTQGWDGETSNNYSDGFIDGQTKAGLMQVLLPASTAPFSRYPIGGSIYGQIEYANTMNSIRSTTIQVVSIPYEIGIGGPTSVAVAGSCKTIVKKNVNKENIRKAACAAGFVAACGQGKLGQMDSIADHVQTVRGVTQSSRLPQQTTHLPK